MVGEQGRGGRSSRREGDLKGSCNIPFLRVAASFAPLLPRAWHEGQHWTLSNCVRVAGPDPHSSRKPSNCSGPSSQGQPPGAQPQRSWGRERGQMVRNKLIWLKLHMEKKGRSSLEPLPMLEGTSEDKVIT